jgi:dihydrofolate synthase / folylpolyglutamate synthase
LADHARSDDPAVQAQLDRFAQLSPGRDILGLERIVALLTTLGNPQDRLPPVFHVAGTNGKGSTCAFLRSILEAAGLKVHVYTSPHLVRFNERIRVAGKLIDDEDLAPLLAEVLNRAEAYDVGPSFFEATTAAALLAFSRTPADACIIEVGLGGRLDATNVVTPVACGIAQVGIDHQAFLGETLAEIAGEKAGIAKAGVPLVCLSQAPEALACIEAVAAEAGAPLLLEGRDWPMNLNIAPSLSGTHQIRNANLAEQMLVALQRVAIPLQHQHNGYGIVRALGWSLPTDGHWQAALQQTRWPARLQKLSHGAFTGTKHVWIDGAHNPAAATEIARVLESEPRHLILGILANKDAQGIIAPLAPHALSLTFIPVPHHDSHDPAVLAKRWGGVASSTLPEAVAKIDDNILIVGSLYLAGEALRLNNQLPD